MMLYTRWLAKKFWMFLAVLTILFAVLVQVGRMVSPLVAENKAAISSYLGEQLGVEIVTDQLSLQWSGLRPELRLRGLYFMGPDGQQVVSVDRAGVQVDLLASFLAGRVKMWKVELDGVHLTLMQGKDERWNILGFNDRSSRSDEDLSSNPIDAFLIGRYVHLQAISLDFQTPHGTNQQIRLANIRLQNQDGFHRFSGNMQDTQQRTVLDFVFEGDGDPRDIDEFIGHGYLELDRVVLQDNLALISPYLEALPALQGSELSAKMWLHSSAKKRLAVEGELSWQRMLEGAAVELTEKRIPTKLKTQFTGSWNPVQGARMTLQNGAISWFDGVSPEINAVLSSPPDSGIWQIRLPELHLDPWLALTMQQPQLPDLVRRLLADLRPSGNLDKLRIDIPLTDPIDFRLSGQLNQVSIQPRKGTPGVEKLNGYLEASALSGFVDIDSGTGFEIFFPDVYRQPIALDQVGGQVAWLVDTKSNQVLVNSGLIQAQGDLGEVTGYFNLDAPFTPKSRPTELTLQLGLQNSDITQHKVLVPYLVPESLREWLGQALVGGDVTQASFLMRGYFGIDSPSARTVQLGINAQNSELKFDPMWPALSDLSGFLNLDDKLFQGFVDEASLLNSLANNVGIELQSDSPFGEGSFLSIDGRLRGSAADGLSLLVDTPLRELLGSSFDSWVLGGDLEADVVLGIPLLAGQPGQSQDVQVQLDNAQLQMKNLELSLEDVSGALRYSSSAGLESSGMKATLWQEPLAATISSESVGTQFRTLIDFQGPVSMKSLGPWLRRPEVNFAEGKAGVLGRITVPASVEGRDEKLLLELGSDLEGVAVNLPPPYGKESPDKVPFSAAISVQSDKQFLRFDYRKYLSVGLTLADTQLTRGLVRLALEDEAVAELVASDLPEAGLLIVGEVATVNTDSWVEVFERYGRYNELYSSGSPGVAEPGEIKYDLSLGTLDWDEYRFDRLNVSGQAISHGWQLIVDHPILAGEVLWFDDKPLKLDLDYFRWPLALPTKNTPEGNAQTKSTFVDPLEAIDPRHIVAMDFSAREVALGDDNFGSWAFLLRPVESGVAVSELQAEIKGAQLGAKPKSAKGGAEFTWLRTDSGDISHFSGMVSSSDLVRVSESWGQPKALEAQRARLLSDLTWLGSPAAVSLAGLEGDVVLDVEKGRFYQSTGTASSALLRLFGLFNFDSWARRLRLDFSDLYKGGMVFDSIDGRLSFAQGQMFLVEPIKVDTPSASLQMGGQIDLREETLDTSMVATLPVGGNATLIAAFAGGLPVAAGVYAVSKLFKRQVDKVASVSYQMTGAWSDPAVEFHKLFDNKAAKKAAEGVREASDAARKQGEGVLPVAD